MGTSRHPEPYDFLMAAGAIDRKEEASNELRKTTEALLGLVRMNGTYHALDPAFRADMRVALHARDDAHVKRVCESIAHRCTRLSSLSEPDRVVLRGSFSRLSHYWPEQPDAIFSRS